MSEERLEIIKENVYMRSEIAKNSRIGIDTSLREELELLKEIERLNNIINELEKYIGQEWYCFDNESIEFEVARDILDKLKQLKENK